MTPPTEQRRTRVAEEASRVAGGVRTLGEALARLLQPGGFYDDQLTRIEPPAEAAGACARSLSPERSTAPDIAAATAGDGRIAAAREPGRVTIS